jgi:hypothetical protein
LKLAISKRNLLVPTAIPWTYESVTNQAFTEIQEDINIDLVDFFNRVKRREEELEMISIELERYYTNITKLELVLTSKFQNAVTPIQMAWMFGVNSLLQKLKEPMEILLIDIPNIEEEEDSDDEAEDSADEADISYEESESESDLILL